LKERLEKTKNNVIYFFKVQKRHKELASRDDFGSGIDDEDGLGDDLDFLDGDHGADGTDYDDLTVDGESDYFPENDSEIGNSPRNSSLKFLFKFKFTLDGPKY
jgi:hypothetical protein